MGIRRYISLALLGLLSACGAGGTTTTGTTGNDAAGTGETSGESAPGEACSGSTVFTTTPLAAETFTGLVPLGNLNPTGHVFPTNHVYFYLNAIDGVPQATTVYAPGPIRITSIGASTYTSATPPYTDYQLYFSPCTEIQAYFLHMSTLSDTISAQLGESSCSTYSTGGTDVRLCNYSLSLDVAAGTPLGTAGAHSSQRALDFGSYDARIAPLTFAGSRYWTSDSGFDQYHVVCPFDYFTDALKTAFYARLGNYDGTILRTAEPRCGTVEQDVAGTAQGLWFVGGTSEFQSEDPHLALVHDNVDPERGAFAVGTSIPSLSSGTYYFAPTGSGTTNRDFDEVTNDGQTYCYDDFRNVVGESIGSQVVILIRLPTATTLQIESQAGSCAGGSWSLSNQAVTFER